MKIGLWTQNDYTYRIFDISKSAYSRIDICERDARFQTQPEKVIYSRVVKKGKTFEYGDKSIYDLYTEFNIKLNSAMTLVGSTDNFDGSKYSIEDEYRNDRIGITVKNTTVNGKLFTSISEVKDLGKMAIVIENDPVSNQDPMNFYEYTELSLGGDSVELNSIISPYRSVEQLRAMYPIEHLFGNDWIAADTIELADQRLKDFMESDEETYALDVETTGLDTFIYGKDVIVAIVLGVGSKSSTLFPFRMETMDNLPNEYMKKIADAFNSKKGKRKNHHIKFDRKSCMKENLDVVFDTCTMTWSVMLDPVVKEKGRHALKTKEQKIIGKKFLELNEIFLNPKEIRFQYLPKELAVIYACPDVTSVAIIDEYQRKNTPKSMLPIIGIEMELSNLKAEQEYYGVRVNAHSFNRAYEKAKYALDVLEKLFRHWTHETGKLTSAPNMAVLLYDKLRCPVLMRSAKSNARSTSNKAIDMLAHLPAEKDNGFKEDVMGLYGEVIIKAKDLNKSKYPALLVFSKYKEYFKLVSSFFKRVDRTTSGSRLSFSINQNGASSGRESSNIHQTPPELKRCIIADTDEYDFWDADYSQIELRLIAAMAGEKKLVEACSDPDADIHRVCASLITGKPQCDITKEERSKYKQVNFGVVYDISAHGLAKNMYRTPQPTKEQIRFAEKAIDEFYTAFPHIKEFINMNKKKVRERGYMVTKFGRIKYFQEVFEEGITRKRLGSIMRQANNMPVQGTGGDIIKMAQVKMYRYMKDKGWADIGNEGFPWARCAVSIHDEIIAMAHKSIPKEEVIEMFIKTMQIDIPGFPPLFVQPALCDDWEGHNDDSLAIPIHLRDKLVDDYKRTRKSVFKSSFFELKPPNDVDFTDTKRSAKDLAKEYLPLFEFTYVRGNYKEGLTENEKINAIIKYIEVGSSVYELSNYRDVLNEYRKSVLDDYMKSVLAEFGPNLYDVGMNIKHPSLTHDLIGMFHQELKGLGLSHRESIVEATRLYFEKTTDTVEVDFEEVKEVALVEDFNAERFQPIYEFDDRGEIIAPEDELDEEDEEEDYLFGEEGEYKNFEPEHSQLLYLLGDAYVADLSNKLESQVNKVLEELFKYSSADGFYKILIIYNGSILDTKMRADSLPIDSIGSFIEEV